MADFGPWLRSNTDNSPALAALRAFATAQGPTWPYHSNTVDDYLAVIDQAAPANASDLKLALYRYYLLWSAQSIASGPRRIGFGSIALVVAGLVIAAFLLFGVFNPTFVKSLSQTEIARGLVTFLFAFATTSVIVVVTIGVLWVPRDEIEVRFSKAKDIMTILISVLGTILGFYFGQAVTENANTAAARAAAAATSAAVTAAKPAPAGGEATAPAAPATAPGGAAQPPAPDAATAPSQKP